jgi:two-component system, LytTR family, response regulator
MKPITVLIVDDEHLAVQRVERLLQRSLEFQVRGTAQNGAEALVLIDQGQIDLLLLDIEMPDMTGLELLGHIEENKRPVIVFITAYDEYALKAFDYFAIDYLLKPFSNERFNKMLERAKEQVQNRHRRNIPWNEVQMSIEQKRLSGNQITVKIGKRYHFIKIDEIGYICADGNYCEINTVYGSKFVHRDTIRHLISILPPDIFYRIHHSHIVSIHYIQSIHRLSFGELDVQMKDGHTLKVSRKYKDRVSAFFKKQEQL